MAGEGDNAQGGAGNQGGASGGGDAGQTGGNAGGQTGGTVLTGGGQQGGQQGGQAGAGSTGNVLPGWLNEVSEGHRSNKMFHNIKGNTLKEASEVLLKNYDNAQRQLGRSIGVPQENDTPQKKAEFDKKINQYRGVPEKIEGYQIDIPEVAGELLQSEIVSDFTQRAHKEGFTNKQLQFVLNEYARVQNQAVESYHTSLKTSLTELQEEWGPRFPRKVVAAQRFVKEFGGPKLMEKLDKSGFGNDPDLVRFLAEAAEFAQESGNFVIGDIVGVDGPASAKTKIGQIQGDSKHPYNNPKMAGTQAHKDAVEEMRRLHEIAYGG